MTKFGFFALISRPNFSARLRQENFIAIPPSIQASEEPIVEVPINFSFSLAFQRSAIMLTQRFSISVVLGYSDLSIAFFSKV